MDGEIEQRVCIKFCVKLGKTAIETLEMLRRAFGEHSLSRTAVFEWLSSFKAGQVSAKDDEGSGRPSISKTTENFEKISRTYPRRPSLNNPRARRHRWDQLLSLSGNLNRKSEHAPHCREVCFPTLDK
jgi:hypothetical protein